MQRWMGTLAAGAAVLAAGSARAQTANATMVVTVVNQDYNPARPVGNVGLNVSFLNGTQKITAALIHTNREGQISLAVTADAQASGDLRIDIYDAPGLVIYQPAEGMVGAAQQQLTLKLLPKGSAALLEPAQIEAMLNRLSRLTLQNQQLQVQLTKQQAQKADLDQALTQWASDNGFSYDEVNQKVQGWAQEVLAHKEEKSLTEQAEAELGLRDYTDAAALFAAAAAASDDEMDREEQELLAKERTELRDNLQAHWQSAKSYLLGNQRSNAVIQMTIAQSRAATVHQHYSDDAVIRSLWIYSSVLLQAVRIQDANANLTQGSVTELKSALQGLSDVQAQMNPATDGEILGYTQIFQGATLLYMATRSSDRDAVDYFAQANSAFQAAAAALSKSGDQTAVVLAEGAIGMALAYEASRVSGPQGVTLAKEAVDTLRAALSGVDKATDPGKWYSLQTGLGGALALEALRAQDSTSPELMAQSVAAMQAAAGAYDKTTDPKNWALAEEGLGNALNSQGLFADPSQAGAIFAKAVAAFQAALEVRSQTSDPGAWATAEGELANALENEAEHSTPDQAKDLMAQSVAAYSAVLSVYTKDGYPQEWARAEHSLGSALEIEAKLTQGAAGLDLLGKAEDADQASLQVFTQADDPEQWARVQVSLGDALATEGYFIGGDQGMDKLQKAADAYEAATQYFSKDAMPRQWATLEEGVGTILNTMGMNAKGEPSTDILNQAAAAWTSALTVDGKNAQVEEELGNLYHEELFDFSKAYDVDKQAEQVDGSDSNRLNLAEASLTAGHFDECLEMVNSVDAAKLSAGEAPARQTLLLACEFGAGEKAAAQTAAGFAAYKAGVTKSGWNTSGDRTYLASAPQFSASRGAWIKLFQSLQDGDGAGMADAAGTLEQAMGGAAQ